MKIIILPEVMAEIRHYIDTAPGECSGLGRVKETEDGSILITKAYYLKQKNTSGSTEIDAEAMADVHYETREDVEYGNLNYHWHSHGNMDVFWSGTDHDLIEKFGGKGFLAATVFNKEYRMRSCYYQAGNGFLPHLFVDDIQTEVGCSITKEQREKWDKTYEANTIKPKYDDLDGWSKEYREDFFNKHGRYHEGYGMLDGYHSDEPDMEGYYAELARARTVGEAANVKTKVKASNKGGAKAKKNTTKGKKNVAKTSRKKS